jgi:plasmid stabilization system protein ParE
MDLVIFWTDFAKKELRKIFDYHKEEASLTIARKIVKGIYESTQQLKSQPEIGQKEELLINRPQGFRYLVYTNYKIIYWINTENQRLEITDVFDARQNPIKIQRNKK